MQQLDPSEFGSWEDLFRQYTVGEVRYLNQALVGQSETKMHDLRALIGGRYKDLLSLSDTIDEMDRLSLDEDEKLSRLCSLKHYSLWSAGVSNSGRFGDPRQPEKRRKLEDRAVAGMLHNVLVFLEFEVHKPQTTSLVAIARGFRLAKELASGERPAKLTRLESAFSSLLERHFDMENPSEHSAPVDMFIATMLFHEMSPKECLDYFMSHRLSLIKNTLDRSEESGSDLLRGLKLASSTLDIIYQAYRNPKLVTKQLRHHRDVYKLVETPELVDKIELDIVKYRQWLPERIQKADSVPLKCLEEEEEEKKKKKTTTKEPVTTEFASKVHSIFALRLEKAGLGGDLGSLISLYRSVIEIFRDFKLLRRELVDGGDPWLDAKFRPKWIEQVQAVLDEGVTVNKNMISDTINSASPGAAGKSPFDDTMIEPTEKNLALIFASLEDHNVGRVGGWRELAVEFENWKQQIEYTIGDLENINKIKSVASALGYNSNAGDDDDEDDGDTDYDEDLIPWTRKETETIGKIYTQFTSYLESSVGQAGKAVVGELGELDGDLAIKSFKLHGYLLADYHLGRIYKGEIVAEKVIGQLYRDVAAKLCEEIRYTADTRDIDRAGANAEAGSVEKEPGKKREETAIGDSKDVATEEEETKESTDDETLTKETGNDDSSIAQDAIVEPNGTSSTPKEPVNEEPVLPVQEVEAPSLSVLSFLSRATELVLHSVGFDDLVWSHPEVTQLRSALCTHIISLVSQPDDRDFVSRLLTAKGESPSDDIQSAVNRLRMMYIPLASTD
ncbi:hypothetical protein TRVA0_013S00716 [Trichomonascus vanleenenianus]|uniref:uncharacterized protein n=1 Tax=Trichomonascus vanleenenianus TaxID=2268995 RepID=UPI003ECB01B1